MTTSASRTEGVHHLGLTVPDLEAARHFFVEGLGFELVGDEQDYPAVLVSEGTVVITLWQVEVPARAIPFGRRRVIGLHHLALRVHSELRLEGLHEVLLRRDDVEIEFAPEPLAGEPTLHMMCRIPGNIRLEVIAPVPM
jgi:catechol 2,3-dioxygenase-like lactoylglutathione lyase family enzyme